MIVSFLTCRWRLSERRIQSFNYGFDLSSAFLLSVSVFLRYFFCISSASPSRFLYALSVSFENDSPSACFTVPDERGAIYGRKKTELPKVFLYFLELLYFFKIPLFILEGDKEKVYEMIDDCSNNIRILLGNWGCLRKYSCSLGLPM